MSPVAWIDYDHGITAVDSGYIRPWLAAVYLIVQGERVAIVDTASNASVERVLAVPLARPETPGVSYRRFRTVAFDGPFEQIAVEALQAIGVPGRVLPVDDGLTHGAPPAAGI